MKALASFIVGFCLVSVAQASPVSEVFYSDRPVVSVRTTVTDFTVENVIENTLDQAYNQIQFSGLVQTGQPFVRYHSDTNATYYVVEAGIPVSGFTASVPVSMRGSLPGGRMATTRYLGPESQLYQAYDSIERYMFANRRVSRGQPWEIYNENSAFGIEVVWPIAVGIPGPAPAP